MYEAEIESRENSVRFRHFDSSRGHNREAAEQTAAQFVRMLQGETFCVISGRKKSFGHHVVVSALPAHPTTFLQMQFYRVCYSLLYLCIR